MGIPKGRNFALLTTGVGYLSGFREVETAQGTTQRYVTIAALRGLEAGVRYTYVDALVCGRKAESYMHQLGPCVNSPDKVLCRFRLRDLRPGNQEGDMLTTLRGELVGIDWARVNGVAVTELAES